MIPRTVLLASLICCLSFCSPTNPDTGVWITTPDQSLLLSRTSELIFSNQLDSGNVINIDPTKTFQSIDGFGYSLTGGSAFLLYKKLSPSQREAILRELFLSDTGIGVSYLRISVGASDLDSRVFSYNDLPAGESDPTLDKFSIEPDRQWLIPVLKEIIALRPAIKIMASPWSPPVWMKTNQRAKGGSLKPEHYGTYARYLTRYVQAMAGEGIHIDAVTLQNEPENPNNTPSMIMTANEQAKFIADFVGPAFRAAGIKTKIVTYDHNCDHPEYPIAILNNRKANSFIDGSAFHLYLGDIEALSLVHDAHPDKNIYFTEQWTSGKGDFGNDLQWHMKNVIIGATRNWSKVVLEWNLAADENYEPHTSDGGCNLCLGALTISNTIKRNVSYYIIAHAAKFIPPGSVRIASSWIDGLPNVAFITPAGKKVLLVLNESRQIARFSIRDKEKVAIATLPAGSVATLVW